MTKLPPQLMSGLKTTDIYFLEAGKSKIKMWAGLVSFEASLSGLQTAALPTDCLPSLLVDVLIFSYCVYAKLLSHVRLFGTPWTVARQAPLSMDSPDKNTGVDCHSLLQRNFLTQGLNPCLLQLLHCRRILYHRATREAQCSYSQ